VFFIEFVRENLLALSALRAFADKRFEVFEVFVAGAMLGC
jgi:hypothetical protein